MNVNTHRIKDVFVNFLIPIVSVVSTLIMVFLIVYPNISSFGELNAELESNRDLELQLNRKLNNLNKLVDFKGIVDENSLLVSRVLVDEPMVPELLTQIDMIAKESGLIVSRLSYSFVDTKESENTSSQSKNIKVLLGANGNFDQIEMFLVNLEKASRLVDARSIRFGLGSAKDGSVYEVTFTLESPYMKVSSAAVTDESVNIDVTDAVFVETINRIKDLKYYEVKVTEEFLEVEETSEPKTAEPVEESPLVPAEEAVPAEAPPAE